MFAVGDRVRVLSGDFRGYVGTVDGILEDGAYRVRLDFNGGYYRFRTACLESE